MKKSTLLSITIALAIPAGICLAQATDGSQSGEETQSGGPGRPPGPPPPPPPLLVLVAIDADEDGILSVAEIANAPASLKELDENGDGQLTIEEILPPPPQGRRHGPPPGDQDSSASPDRPRHGGDGKSGGPGRGHHGPPAILKALDADGDRTISASEIQGSTAALKALDKNSDGQLGPMEYGGRPPHPPCPPPEDGNGAGGGNQTAAE